MPQRDQRRRAGQQPCACSQILPARRFVWTLDRARNMGILDLPNSASKRIEVALSPMLGRLAVARG